jgi:hypothetical protein
MNKQFSVQFYQKIELSNDPFCILKNFHVELLIFKGLRHIFYLREPFECLFTTPIVREKFTETLFAAFRYFHSHIVIEVRGRKLFSAPRFSFFSILLAKQKFSFLRICLFCFLSHAKERHIK